MSSTRLPTVAELQNYTKAISFVIVHFVPAEKTLATMQYTARHLQEATQSTRTLTGSFRFSLDDLKRAMQPFMKDVINSNSVLLTPL